MGLDKLFAMGAMLAILAAGTGQLPKIILAVRIAELKLLKESQASKWPKLLLLEEPKQHVVLHHHSNR